MKKLTYQNYSKIKQALASDSKNEIVSAIKIQIWPSVPKIQPS